MPSIPKDKYKRTRQEKVTLWIHAHTAVLCGYSSAAAPSGGCLSAGRRRWWRGIIDAVGLEPGGGEATIGHAQAGAQVIANCRLVCAIRARGDVCQVVQLVGFLPAQREPIMILHKMQCCGVITQNKEA